MQLRVAVAADVLLSNSPRPLLSSAEGVYVHLRGADPSKALLSLIASAEKLKRRETNSSEADANLLLEASSVVRVASRCFLKLLNLLVARKFNSELQTLRPFVRELILDALASPLTLRQASTLQISTENANDPPLSAASHSAVAMDHLTESTSWLQTLADGWGVDEAMALVSRVFEAAQGEFPKSQ